MDRSLINTLVYFGLLIGIGGIGFFLKRTIVSVDKAIEKLNTSVDSLVRMVADHEADHKIFVLKIEHLGDKVADHEERLDELESK